LTSESLRKAGQISGPRRCYRRASASRRSGSLAARGPPGSVRSARRPAAQARMGHTAGSRTRRERPSAAHAQATLCHASLLRTCDSCGAAPQLAPLRAGQAAVLPGPAVPLGLPDLSPAPSFGNIEVPATCPTDRSPRWHSSTISALNSQVETSGAAGAASSPCTHGRTSFLGQPLLMDVIRAGLAHAS
jgi:hypothetical protein